MTHFKFLLLSFLLIFCVTCKKDKSFGSLRVQGKVVNKITGAPISNALIEIYQTCYGSSFFGSGNAKHTYGKITTDINGNYDLTASIESTDKDCNDFECRIEYLFNESLATEYTKLKRNDNISSKITEFYLHAGLFVSVKHTSALPLVFWIMDNLPIDPSIGYQGCVQDTLCGFTVTCNAVNYFQYQVYDTIQKVVYHKTDSVYCDKTKTQYHTTYY